MQDLFSPEADRIIAKAFAWLAERELYQSPEVSQGRLYRQGMVFSDDEQHQAFGLADLGYGPELGYISIAELIEAGAEIDLYFTPKPLGEIKT